MKKKINVLLLIILLSQCGLNLFGENVQVIISKDKASIENDFLTIGFNLINGRYDCIDKLSGQKMIQEAWFRIDPGETEWILPSYIYQAEDMGQVNDLIGEGRKIRVWYMPQDSYDPDRIIDVTVYRDKKFIVLNWGIRNRFEYTIKVKKAELISGGVLFHAQSPEDTKVLRSGAGSTSNFVENTWEIKADNGAMLTYTDGQNNNSRHTIVGGGLLYREFAKSFETFKGNKRKNEEDISYITLSVWDPIGKNITSGETWISEDSYYLDFTTIDPFVSLEQYGTYLALANNASPNKYDFPTLCGWMVSTRAYGEGKPINNSPGLVDQMDKALASGILKYTDVAVRLEPDYYCYTQQGNTQQGWWDDEHWALYGSLIEPYETFNEFCKAVNQNGGKVFTYFQASMPSNDFAREHPKWMLNDDISLLHVDHRHHHPLVRYDYSNPELQSYILKMWQRLRNDGVEGIKFDYPETGWTKVDGFDDKSYTTTSAYRKIFELCREGLGDEAFIHERALGESNTPRLDCSVGIVDLQRVWGDASHFEPEMASRIGLRWFKQGKAFRYYPDGKSFYNKGTPISKTERRSVITLIGLLSGRLELGTSFGNMTPEMMHDLTRLYPVLPNGKTFRPVDMFLNKTHPEIYTYTVNEKWKQVIITNSNSDTTETIKVPLSGDQLSTGSLGLSNKSRYHIFDFWNQKSLGTFNGDSIFHVSLKNKETNVYAIHEIMERPQIIGTNRHIMCGMMELNGINWDNSDNILSFEADIIEDETMVVYLVIPSDFKLKKAVASGAQTTISDENGIITLRIKGKRKENITSVITLSYKQSQF